MFKIILIILFSSQYLNAKSQVTEITSIIQAGITKVIRAIDLEVQRMQTETIGLQRIQKQLENGLSHLRLQEIGDWAQKQQQLFAGYYQELATVKEVISGYREVKSIVNLQKKIGTEYKKAWDLFKQDAHFSPTELEYMGTVYGGMVKESIMVLEKLLKVVESFRLTLNDSERLRLIHEAHTSIESIYQDLRQFNSQQMRLSVVRSKGKGELDFVKQLYGLL